MAECRDEVRHGRRADLGQGHGGAPPGTPAFAAFENLEQRGHRRFAHLPERDSRLTGIVPVLNRHRTTVTATARFVASDIRPMR
jgi:hypothetical protein